MNINSDDMVSVTDVSKQVSTFISRASEGRQVVVMRNNHPAAAIVDIGTMERLQRLDELEEDMRLLSVAMVRVMTDNGRRHTLDDVAAELGVDLSGD